MVCKIFRTRSLNSSEIMFLALIVFIKSFSVSFSLDTSDIAVMDAIIFPDLSKTGDELIITVLSVYSSYFIISSKLSISSPFIIDLMEGNSSSAIFSPLRSYKLSVLILFIFIKFFSILKSSMLVLPNM